MAIKVNLTGSDKLSKKVRGATKAFKTLAKTIKGLAFGFGTMDRVIRTALIGASIKLAANMQKGLAEISTLLGDVTEGEIKDMGDELQRLGAISGQTMDKLTKAKYDIISAGFTGAAESADLLTQSSKLAVGGVTDIAIAADLLTTTINAYGDAALSATETSDKLFTIVRLGKTTIGELAGSMGRLLSVAGQMGVNLDEVGAALATLTATGQSTEEATTAIRATMVSMLQPTQNLADLMEKVGFKSGFAMLQARGFAESVKLLSAEAKKTGRPMTDFFNNVRAMQAILPLTGKAADRFADNMVEMAERSAGAADEAFTKMQKTFSVSMSRLRAQAENIMRTIGTQMIKGLQPKVDKLNEILTEFGDIGWDAVGTALATNVGKIMGKVVNMLLISAKIIKLVITDALLPDMSVLTKAWTAWGAVLAENLPFMDKLLGASAEQFRAYGEAAGDIGPKIDVLVQQLRNELAATLEFVKVSAQDAKDASDELAGSLGETGDAAGGLDKVAGAAGKLRAALADISPTMEKVWVDMRSSLDQIVAKFGTTTEALQSAVNDSMNAMISINESGLAIRQGDIETAAAAEIAIIQRSSLAQEEKQKKIDAINADAFEKSKAVARDARKIRIAIAISETALAVLKSFRNAGGWPLGLVPAGLTAAAGAAQVAAIVAQPYGRGGRVVSNGTDSVLATLAPNEFVSTQQAAERFEPELRELNAAAETGASPMGRGDTINIFALDSRSFEMAARRNPRGMAAGIKVAIQNRNLILSADENGNITAMVN